MFSKALLAATVIGAATAQLPAIAKRDFIENRQYDDLDVDPTCKSALSAIETIYSSVPTPPADLLSVTLPADPCVTPSFTGTLESEWSSYTSEALQWYTSHADDFANFLTACSGLVDESAATNIPVCSSDLTALGSAPTITTPAQTTTDATGSGPASSTGASSTPSSSPTVATPNAAARETGFVVAAAMAAAGFMGAVAVL
ncbi:hypothetical protein E0Z10_g2955 [Xylaria hypoxylon]|uniref:Infection structure specific protein n=1 Tax=Xylaria hypoxylon TaxID=37992 RepID=A0A4Z0Z4T8_9PEZI|nr:hypothetical protein E0Z10_g2955 [Xylaria hypoxylon]